MKCSAVDRKSTSRARLSRPQSLRARRRLFLEKLEDRALMAGLPYGAMADDTGEFMLGDVTVSVVLLESTTGLGPNDANTENWTSEAINTVKQKVQDGMNWWKETLDATFPNAPDGLLNFDYNWTYADNPVQTGYEAISRRSDDFELWIYDFLNLAGFNQTGSFSSDIRAFNNFQRLQNGSDWAFTIFVVNNANDTAVDDGLFADGGSFRRAFSYAGGRFMVVPALRPESTFAHEAGHMFWAMDEYAGASNYSLRRGYYNTQNVNAIQGNPNSQFDQAVSIMTNEPKVSAAYSSHTSSQSSLEMVGWKDSDGDGIFDVLDVPFSLTGSGRYNVATGQYVFNGTSAVRTLANQNSSGLQNDITINRIRRAEYSIDDGPWQLAANYDTNPFQTSVSLSFPVPAGDHTIKIRTFDTRTGVESEIFHGVTFASSAPATQAVASGITGFAFKDDNGNGVWEGTEQPLVDMGIEIVDLNDQPITLARNLDPSTYSEGASLNNALPEVTLTAIGSDVQSNVVTARASTKFLGNKVFYTTSTSSVAPNKPLAETWTSSSRVLRVDFSQPVSTVSIKALSSGTLSYGRMEAYDAAGNLIDRVTSGALTTGKNEVLTISRGATDIAYVLVKGHAGTDVILDDLKWGPRTSATTNAQGAYSLNYLPAPGTYRIRAIAPPGYVAVTPQDGITSVGVSGALGVGNVNFAFRNQSAGGGNPWYNVTQPKDVNQDSFIVAQDALIVINYLNTHPGNSPLPATRDPGVLEFIDVDNDGYCTALDALIVINHLNNPPSSFAANAVTPGGLLIDGENAGGEGELSAAAFSAPANAAEYYARQPLHLLHIAGDDEPHVHADAHEHEPEGSSPAAAALFVASVREERFSTPRLPAKDVLTQQLARQLLRSLPLPVAASRELVDGELDLLAADSEAFDAALESLASDAAPTTIRLPDFLRRSRGAGG